MKSSENRPASTRGRILSASAQVILQKGVRDASVKDILETADICRRTFYQHFKSKDDAFRALYREEATDRLYNAMNDAILAESDPFGRVLASVDAFLNFEQTGGSLLARLQSEALNGESSLHEARVEVFDRLVVLVDKTVQDNLGIAFDPMIYRTLFLGIEGIVVHEQNQQALDAEQLARIRRVIRPMVVGIFANASHLPTAKKS